MENTVKIAVVTDDGQTISAHFGRAKYYQFYTLVDGKITAEERMEKSSHHHDHGDHHDHGNVQIQADGGKDQTHNHDDAERHASMFAPLTGCQVVLARGMGYGAHNGLNAIGVKPVITDIRLIADAIKAYADGTIVDHPERLH